MKLTCLQGTLKRGLAVVGHMVPNKTSLPVLANVLFIADGKQITLTASNLEMGITCTIPARIEEAGAITLPAKLLTDLMSHLPNESVRLALDDATQTIQMRCAAFESSIHGIDADEFPIFPQIAKLTPFISLPAQQLREALEHVTFAAATNDSRPVLNGVLLRLKGMSATLAAVDGYRLSVYSFSLLEAVSEPQELIIPARAFRELSRMLTEVEAPVAVRIGPQGNHIFFHTEGMALTARLIDGEFPEFERIIPTHYSTRIVLDTNELAKAVKLASYFTTSSANAIKLHCMGEAQDPSTLILSANVAEVGNNTSILDGQISGEQTQIALNVRFVAEALSVITTPHIALELQGKKEPAVLKSVGVEGFTHVIMSITAL
jgi:DNA polymerase-3 subunit beta